MAFRPNFHDGSKPRGWPSGASHMTSSAMAGINMSEQNFKACVSHTSYDMVWFFCLEDTDKHLQ